jgi:hypothetical protein
VFRHLLPELRGHTGWAAHNVTAHRHGTKRFCHPEFGDLTLTYNVFEVTAAPGLSLVGYTAEPNGPSAQAMSILASWTFTDHRPSSLSPNDTTTGASD